MTTAQASDPNGFEVEYIPDPGECKDGQILLYQIISSTGLAGKFAHVDGKCPKTGCKLPPPMTPKGDTQHSYIDSPGGKGTGGLTGAKTFKLTAVAACRSKCQDKILSTYYFEFDNETRQLQNKGTKKPSHYKDGMKNWIEQGGSQ